MATIFLSYSRSDRPKAQVVAEALAAEGFSVWWDKVLRAGQTYDEVTEGMLRDADVVIVLWSAVSVKSKWVRAEATLGQRTSVLIPAMIEDTERPIMFELMQSADLIGWEGDRADPRWKEFVSDVRRGAEHAAPVEAAPVIAPAAMGQAPDMSMELTFWNSVDDSDDKADFEAYLKRYPDGHYSDLARNRIAAIMRAEAKAAALSPPLPPPPPPPIPAAAPTLPAPASREAAPIPPRREPPAPARPAANPVSRKPSSQGAMIAGGVFAILIAGWGLSQMMPGEPDQIAIEEPVAQTTAPGTEPEKANVAATAVTGDEVSEPAPSEPAAPACDVCPAMVKLAGGTFRMGSPETEPGREPAEGPVRDVVVKPFSISKTEITAAQWTACVDDGGCGGYRPAAAASGDMPVNAVSWRDASAYARWLSDETGQAYRLPTEAEWEYAARGGTTTAYWWGETFDAAMAPRDKIREAASLPENAFGLRGMLGNVSEWVEDCYVGGYAEAPLDGSAVTSGDCSRRVLRGGSIKSGPSLHRAANRSRVAITTRDRGYGFRLALGDN